jgi:hypothetical protein
MDGEKEVKIVDVDNLHTNTVRACIYAESGYSLYNNIIYIYIYI